MRGAEPAARPGVEGHGRATRRPPRSGPTGITLVLRFLRLHWLYLLIVAELVFIAACTGWLGAAPFVG